MALLDYLLQVAWKLLPAASTIAVFAYIIASAVHNLYLHPLARFPGPKKAALSNFPYCQWFLGGRQPYVLLELHKKYGPVIRTAPNELSFNSAQSWKDIYDFRQGHRPFVKSVFYEGGSFADQCGSIVSERNPAAHGKMRKDLSAAFSQRSLMEQESLISTVVDRFIEQLEKVGTGGVNMVDMYTMMTFDIIGDLAFGETFRGIETGEKHPWISRIEGAMMQGALADCFKRFPSLAKIVMTVMPGTIQKIIADTKLNENYSIDLTKKRIKKKTDRKDFLSRILEHRDEAQISDVQIAAHASDFVLAGSETTATALSCITYYLARTPHASRALHEEIRGAFQSYNEINASSTTPLKYLNAVIFEGMRMYPPLPFALPRVVPEGGDTVDGHLLPAGTVVSTNPTAASLDPANFQDPWTFKPERWLRKDTNDVLNASQPFSLGPRVCIGRRQVFFRFLDLAKLKEFNSLGWMELRTTLAKLHFTYDLELVDKDFDWHEKSRMHTLWQKPRLMVKITTK